MWCGVVWWGSTWAVGAETCRAVLTNHVHCGWVCYAVSLLCLLLISPLALHLAPCVRVCGPVTKIIITITTNTPPNTLAQVIADSQPSPNGEARPFYDFLESCLRHKAEMVIFEAARAICNLRDVTARELSPAITVLQLFLSSSKPVLRFAAGVYLGYLCARMQRVQLCVFLGDACEGLCVLQGRRRPKKQAWGFALVQLTQGC